MPDKKRPYHHGDLRAGLIDTAIELIAEKGVRGFSLAEASRRLGVTVAAPYRHFTDRDDLLAAVAVRAYQVLAATVTTETGPPPANKAADPAQAADRLAGIARAYVRFAAQHRPLFDAVFSAGLDKSRYPQLQHAAQPVTDAALQPARLLCGGDDGAAVELLTAIAATAHGLAALLLDGALGDPADQLERTAARAATAARALIHGRAELHPPGPGEQDH